MQRSYPHRSAPWLLALTVGVGGFLGVVVHASAQNSSELPSLSVPADLVRALHLPGSGEEIRRPSALFTDEVHGEILVADSQGNRIVIFDRDGVYRYEFDCADHVTSPVDLVVDSEGFIYVLGTTKAGRRIVRYDFDGAYLSEFALDGAGLDRIASLAIDSRDRLFAIDHAGFVHVITRQGELERTIDVAAALPEDSRQELILGHASVQGSRLMVPAATLGAILLFDTETGEAAGILGQPGNTVGQLNFPVAVAALGDDAIAVLDKMRFNIVCYSTADGRFLGEFGGKGMRDGWFYHPTLLATSGANRVIVGQILDNRIQLCQVPQFVRTRLNEQPGHVPAEAGDEVRKMERADGAQAELLNP